MNIAPDPKAWKPWRRAVRRRVKASPALRREYRKASKLHLTQNHSWSALRFIIPVVIGGFAWHAPASAALLGIMALWTLLVTVVRTQHIANTCHFPGELWLFYSWPLSDDTVFAHQRRLVFRSSLWLGLDWLVFGTVIALRTDDSALLAATPLVAVGQWSAALAVALFLGRKFPRIPYTWISTALGVLLFVAAHLASKIPSLLPALDFVYNGLLTATPAGWFLQGWQLIASGNVFGWLALVLLAGSAVACLVIGSRLIRPAFNPERIFGYNTTPEVDAFHPPSEEPLAPSTPVSPATVRAALEIPAGLAFTSRGPVERSLAWFLSARQRVLVDFMLPGGHPWHRRGLLSIGLLVLAFILRETTTGFALFPSLMAMAFALPLTGGRWSGFDPIPAFQAQIAMHAYAPVGFVETARLLLKINALHCLLAFPLILAATGLGLTPSTASPAWTFDYAVRITGLVFALQPLFLIGKFSANSNDSSGGKFFIFGLLIVVIGGFLAAIILCIVTIGSDRFTTALACIGGLLALTHGMLACYGFAWSRGWFDQMARIRE